MKKTSVIWTGMVLGLLLLASMPIPSPGEVPTIERDGENIVANWDLSTADNLTAKNVTIAGGNATLAQLAGRFELDTQAMLTGTYTDIITSGGALVLDKAPDWWDANYTFRSPIIILNNDGTALPQNFTYNFTMDTASLVAAGKMRSDLRDLRLVKQSSGSFSELDRAVLSPNNISSTVHFKGDSTLSPGAWWNSTYYIYYGNPAANAPPENGSKVFLYYDDFSTDTRSNYSVQKCLLDQNGGTAPVTHDAVKGRLVVTAGGAGPGATLIAPVQAQNARIDASMLVSGYNKQGQRDSNFELVTRYTNMNNYYVDTFSLAWNDPAVFKWVTGTQTGPLVSAPGTNPQQNKEYVVWMSTVNGTIKGGLNTTQLFSTVDASLGSTGNLGFGISSGTGYIDNLTIRLDIERWPTVQKGLEEGILRSPGTLISQPLDAGTAVTWDSVNWSSITPTGTSIVLNTRTSPDMVTWTPWSSDLTTGTGTPVPSTPDRYLQFRVFLSASGATTSPSLSWIGVNHTRYASTGTFETEDLDFTHVIGWVGLNVTQDTTPATGSSITWEVSNNTGLNWKPVPANGDLSSQGTSGRLRLRATLMAGNTTQTPIIEAFEVRLMVDRPPVLMDPLPALSFPEDTSLLDAVNLTKHFQDDGPLVFEGRTSNGNLSVMVHENGSVDLATNTANWTGKTTVVFRATDAYGLQLEAQTEVTVTPVNDEPVIVSLPPTRVFSGNNYTYQVLAVDGDGDALSYKLDKAPSGMTVGKDGKVAWTPNTVNLGSNMVNLSVSDNMSKAHQNFTVLVERIGGNHAPIIESSPTLLANTGTAYQYQVVATDSDNDTLGYSLDTAPSGMTIAPVTGLIEWLPGPAQLGNFTVVVNVSDMFTSTTQSFTINVTTKPPNALPVLSGLKDQQVKGGKTVKLDLSKFVTDKDDPWSNLTWDFDFPSDLFTAKVEGTNLVIEPIKGASGKGNLTITVTDRKGGSDTKTIVVEVVKAKEGTLLTPMMMGLAAILLILCIMLIAWAFTRKPRPQERALETEPVREAKETKEKEVIKREKEGTEVHAPPKEPSKPVVVPPSPLPPPPPVPEKVDDAADISKARDYMVAMLISHFVADLKKDEMAGLAVALKSVVKDPVITKLELDEKGLITLELGADATLDSAAIAFGKLSDDIIRARYSGKDGKGLRYGRQVGIGVIEEVLGDDKGPAVTALRGRLLQGATAPRLTSGVQGLDALIGGGIPKGEAVLFQVPAGGVKDALAEQMLKEALLVHQGVIVSFSNSSPAKFLEESDKKGMPVKAWGALGELRIIDWHSYKTMRVKDIEKDGIVHKSSKSLTNLAIAITDASKELKEDLVKRAVLDVVTPAMTIYGLDPTFKFLQTLVAKLKAEGLTSIFIIEKDMHEPEDIAILGQNFDTVLDIERKKEGGSVTMDVTVLSMSVPGYCSDVRKIEITKNGLVVSDGRQAG